MPFPRSSRSRERFGVGVAGVGVKAAPAPLVSTTQGAKLLGGGYEGLFSFGGATKVNALISNQATLKEMCKRPARAQNAERGAGTFAMRVACSRA